MTEPLGLSIGVANLVAARAEGAPVVRASVVTLFDQRPSDVGLPEENSGRSEPGLVLRGFVERIGDRAPLQAADGTKYGSEALTVEALEAMARGVGYGSPITIAVPAYWSPGQVNGLRDEFFAQPVLTAQGAAPMLISDAAAAVTALSSEPGFPTSGVVAVCDLGAGGTSITLANAGPASQQIATVRLAELSGDGIDRLIASQVQGAPLASCRRAKEELSSSTSTTIAGVALSRSDLERLISRSVDQLAATVKQTLQRNGIDRNALTAVAAVGGGAAIPLVTTRLSEHLQTRVFAAAQPVAAAAVGAALVGRQQASAGAATAMGAAVETPTETLSGPPTELASAGQAPTERAPRAGDTTRSVAQSAIAWSQDASSDEPVPYTGPEIANEYGREPTGLDYADGSRYPAETGTETGGLPWYKRTALVLTVGGAAAAVLVTAVLALTLGRSHGSGTPQPKTVTVTLPNGSTTESVVPPPSSAEAPATTSGQPATTEPSTTSQPPTTTSSPPPTTTPPTTTTTTSPPSTTTTTAPPTTSQSSAQQTTTSPSRHFPFGPGGR